MKFDFIIGNPPYQEETAQKETSNGQKTQKNVFHYFQMQAEEVAVDATILIYPGGRWIHQSGKGMKEFGLKQINDPHLSRVIFYQDAENVFKEAEIFDGVSIVLKQMQKAEPGFEYTYIASDGSEITIHAENPGETLMPLDPRDHAILKKLERFIQNEKLTYMHEGILPRTFFGIESNFVENNPDMVREYVDDTDVNYAKEIKLFTNDKSGKAGRGKWYIANKDIISRNSDKLSEWQVVVSSANAGGQKRDNQLEIMDNHSAFGRSRVALKSFKSKHEAENFYKYMKTYVVRYAFLMTDEALTSLGKRVPDVKDYTDANPILNFNEDLDQQLFDCIGLDVNEILYIKERVDSIRK